MKRNLLLMLLGVMLLPFPALAGIYGTLTGRITDNDGKGLVGATVVIEGTTKGAKTKADGKYTITGITSGTYTVRVTFTGFKKFTKQVTISADATMDMNAKLVPDILQTGVVDVIAKPENKMVDDNRVGTIRAKGNEQVREVVRDNIQGVAALSAGVQLDGGGFVVRGSRSTQTQIKVDGLDVGDQFSGGLAGGGTYSPTVSNFAVEELQVLSGAFSAEYGNALGGIVNTVVKSGRIDAYEGLLRYRTDIPSLFGKAGNGVQLQGKVEDQFDLNFGGPIPLVDGSSFFFAAKYVHEQFRAARLGVIDPLGNNLGQLPNQQAWVQNLNGKLKFTMSNITLYIGGQFGLSSVEGGDWGWLYANDVSVKNIREENGRIVGDTTLIPENRAKTPVFNTNVNSVYARINHQLSEDVFYEFTVSVNSNITRNGKRSSFDGPGLLAGIPIYDPIDELQVSGDPNAIRLVPGKDKAIDVYQSPQGEIQRSDLSGKDRYTLRNHLTGYIENGEDNSGTNNAYGLSRYFSQHGNERTYEIIRQNYLQFDGFFAAPNIQTGEVRHNFKTGFELRLYENRRHYNSLPWDGNPFYDIYTDEFGGNIYLDSVTSSAYKATSQAKKPMSASLYVQDQITYRGVIISPGVRFDYFDANSVVRSGGAFLGIDRIDEFQKNTVKTQISPRISITYPITDRSNMSISYGVYFQMPQMNNLYNSFNVVTLRGANILGNPNLAAQRTNMYQVSYNHQLSDDFAFDAVAYYKDSYNLLGVRFVEGGGNRSESYTEYAVAEYGTSRGIELTLEKRPTDNIGFNINYTLAFTNTSASNAESNYGATLDPYANRYLLPLLEFPFSNDRRHYVKGQLNFIWRKDEGPSIGGIKFLENATINLTGDYRTGLPFTLVDRNGNALSEINGNRHPSYSVFDLRLSKTFELSSIFGDAAGKSNIEIFVEVKNLLNRTEPVNFYPRSNNPDFDFDMLNRNIGDFSDVVWYKESIPNDPISNNTSQYDFFGNRLYSPQADFNNDGGVTLDEKFQSYQKYIADVLALRGNYQTPRSVFIGAAFRF